jgi:hypothetical protein
MIYELRTYWAAPGKHEALHSRFRDLTLRIFARHNMQVVGFWTPNPETEESGSLVYMLTFASEEAMKQAWDAMRADPEWRQGKAATEVDGPLVTRLTSQVLRPTDYSPLQ